MNTKHVFSRKNTPMPPANATSAWRGVERTDVFTNYSWFGLLQQGFFFFFLCVVSLATPSRVFAATLSIDPPDGHYGPGDTFVLTVRLETALGECVNAVAVELEYSADWMKASAVSKGESLLSLWPEEPSVDLEKGVVKFEGGIPAGYCGRIQGDPEKTNILAKVIFSIPGNMIGGKVATGPELMTVKFGQDSKVLLNDGLGSAAPLTFRSGAYTRELASSATKNEWLDIVHGDTVPPDSFTILLEHDKNTLQGKYFIIFLTVDKQSGVEHYEVTEDDPLRPGFVRGKVEEKALFVSATSPYVLHDQTLGSRVIVRAFDHAGNVQEAILPPSTLSRSPDRSGEYGGNYLWWSVSGLLALLLIGVITWFYRRSKTRSEPFHT